MWITSIHPDIDSVFIREPWPHPPTVVKIIVYRSNHTELICGSQLFDLQQCSGGEKCNFLPIVELHFDDQWHEIKAADCHDLHIWKFLEGNWCDRGTGCSAQRLSSLLWLFPMNDKLSTCVLRTSNFTSTRNNLLFFSLNELLIKTRLNSLPKTTFLTGQNLIIWQQNFNRFYQLNLIIPLQLILKISLGSISFQSLSSKSLSSSCFHPPSIGFELIGTIIIIFVQRMERRRSMMYFNFIASLPSSAAYTNAVLLTDYGRLRKRPRRDKAKR